MKSFAWPSCYCFEPRGHAGVTLAGRVFLRVRSARRCLVELPGRHRDAFIKALNYSLSLLGGHVRRLGLVDLHSGARQKTPAERVFETMEGRRD
jgi:hypothetical protein